MIDEILDNTFYSTIIIFLSQIGFIYLRTLNVIYTAELRMLPTIVTGNIISLVWLVSTYASLNSVMNGDWIPLIAFLLGGTLGTFLAIRNKIKERDKKKDK